MLPSAAAFSPAAEEARATFVVENETTIEVTHDIEAFDNRKIDWWIFGRSYFLICLSTMLSDVLKVPLSISKVDMQHEFGVTTNALSHVDTAFLVAHAIGHALSPVLAMKAYEVFFACLYQLIMGICLPFLFFSHTIRPFVVVYAIIGFLSSPYWVRTFSHLGSWLPQAYSFYLITIYFTCYDLGYIFGNFVCSYIHTVMNWKFVFVFGGLSNAISAILLFAFYNVKYCNDERKGDAGASTPRAVDNTIAVKELWRMIKTPRPSVDEFIRAQVETTAAAVGASPSRDVHVSTTDLPLTSFGASGAGLPLVVETSADFCVAGGAGGGGVLACFKRAIVNLAKTARRLFNALYKFVVHYCVLINRVRFIFYHTAAFFVIKISRQSFVFWVPYYLVTEHSFEIKNGSWVSVMFSSGCVVGNLTVGYFGSNFLQDAPIFACALWTFGTCATLATFAVLQSPTVFGASIVALFFGAFTIGAETLIVTRGTKILCDVAGTTSRESLIVLGFLLSTATFGSIMQGSIVTNIVKWFGWSALFATLSVLLLVGSVLLLLSHKGNQSTLQ